MKITYDSLADMAYVCLKENNKTHKTTEQGEYCIDWNKKGQIIGIEYFGKPKIMEWDYNLEKTIDKDGEIRRLEKDIKYKTQLLKEEEDRRELAESEWGVYAKMAETMAKRILELENKNTLLTKELEKIKQRFN